MKIVVVTADRFNEIDTFVALHILNRLEYRDWNAVIVSSSPEVTSMNGVHLTGVQPLELTTTADVVLFGSGRGTADAVADSRVMNRIRVDPARQLIGSQCSGALFLAGLGLLRDMPACTDQYTRRDLEAAGVRVLEQAFHAEGNIASAGGCLSAVYLASWVILRILGEPALEEALSYVTPVSETQDYMTRVRRVVQPFVALSHVH